MSSSPPPADAPEESLSWVVTPETDRVLRALRYGDVAAFCGAALLFGGMLVALGFLSLAVGRWRLVVGLMLALALGVAAQRATLVGALTAREEGLAGSSDSGWAPSRRGGVAAAVIGAVVYGVVLAMSGSRGGFLAVGGLFFTASLLAMLLRTDATVDAGAMVLETERRRVELSALSGIHALSLGRWTVFWLAYARGADALGHPRVLTVPHELAPRVRKLLDAGVDAPADAEPVDRARRVVVALFAAGTVGTGAALALLVGGVERGAPFGAYVLALSLVFAAPMAWYALKA